MFEILIVLTEADLRAAIVENLERTKAEAYSFHFASDGYEALEALKEHPKISLVLSELNLKRLDGLKLLAGINEKYPSTKMIVLAPYQDVANVRTALNRGAIDFIAIPIDFEELNRVVKKTIYTLQNQQAHEKKIKDQELSNYKQELALRIQHSLLPKENLINEEVSLYGYLLLGEKPSGNFYYFYESKPRCVSFVIAEIVVTDILATLLALIFRTALKSQNFFNNNPAEALENINKLIVQENSKNPINCFFGELNLDTGILTYVNCNLSYCVLLDSQGGMIELPKNTTSSLGTDPNQTFTEETLKLSRGDRIVLSTLKRTQDSNKSFSVDNLNELISENHSLMSERLIKSIAEVCEENRSGTIGEEGVVFLLLTFNPQKNISIGTVVESNTDAFAQFLENIASQLSAKVKEVLDVLAKITGEETAHLHAETVADIEKITTGAHNEQRALIKFSEQISSLESNRTAVISQLSTLRHDLRTPINAIKGYSEIILEEFENSADPFQKSVSAKVASIPGISRQILGLIDLVKEKDEISSKPKKTVDVPPVPIEVAQESVKGPIKESAYSSPRFLPESIDKIYKKKSIAAGSILIVDDIESNRDLLEDWLKRKRYRIFTAGDGKEALNLLEQTPNIDIVLLDIMMPGMDGYEVLNRIKNDKHLVDVIVIMISALDEMDSIVRCITSGAEDYLIKPFNSFLLEARINTCLEKKRLRDIDKAYISSLHNELNFAQKIQLSMLPTHFPVSDRYSMFGQMLPAQEVGGDFFDWYELGNNKIGVSLGDISGKGPSAALFMAETRTILSTLAAIKKDAAEHLSDMIKQANSILCQDNESLMFVTLFYGVLDIQTGHFKYVNAGHWPPVILKPNGLVTVIQEGINNLPLGFNKDLIVQEFQIQLDQGDTFFLFSDGVTEAEDNNGMVFGSEGLEKILKENSTLNPQKLVEKVVHSVVKFTAEEDQVDDITCLALRFGAES